MGVVRGCVGVGEFRDGIVEGVVSVYMGGRDGEGGFSCYVFIIHM